VTQSSPATPQVNKEACITEKDITKRIDRRRPQLVANPLQIFTGVVAGLTRDAQPYKRYESNAV